MKKNNLLKTVLLLVFTILFLWSCRQESLYTDTKNNNNQKVHNKISLNTFKQETKVSKIEEFTVLKNSKSNGKDAGTTSTFIIDSTSIYKLAVNNNFTTYSFRAYNIFESPNVLYNLVYHIKDGKTGYRIFKMEKDSAIPVYDSEIGAITIKKSSSKSISKTAGCTESIKIYIWDCKNGHDWEHCDHCKDCYDVSYYDVTYDCSGGLSGGSGTSTGTPPSNNAPQCGESNAGYSGVMLDPSGYYFDPNEPLSIDAEKLRASYAYNFWNQLDQNHQLWVYNGNIDTYRFILENYLNNYSTTNNTNNLNFANWGIDFFTQNPTTSLEQFQNWFMGESEGQDGEYDLASEIAFQQQQFQKHSLPSMTSYENAFPSNPNATYPNYYRDAAPNYEVYNNYVGGRLKQLFNQNGGNIIGNPYRNACAVRQSFTHNKLGIMIPFQHNDHKGDYNWNYILTASKMGVFLEGTYGPPTHKLIGTDANDLKKIGDFLKGKTGIYLVINNDPSKNTGAGYTGHTDMIKNGYVSGGANVTNSSGQIVRGGIKYIYIWELK